MRILVMRMKIKFIIKSQAKITYRNVMNIERISTAVMVSYDVDVGIFFMDSILLVHILSL